MNKNLDLYINFSKKFLNKSDNILKKSFDTQLDINYKRDESPVTKIDKRVEKLFRSELKKTFPSHQVLGEEYNNLNITNGEMGKSNFNYNIVKDNDIIARKTHSRNSLDNFVIKKNIKKKINIFPEKKVVNLYDKKLKKKGIKKKKKIVK